MKKLYVVVVLMLLLFTGTACESSEGYDNLSIDRMFYGVEADMVELRAEIAALEAVISWMDEQDKDKDTVIEDLLARIAELEAREQNVIEQSQISRFFDMLIETSLLGGAIQFVELGDTVEGVVNSWEYTYIIVELTRDTQVEIIFEEADASGDWNMNLYHNNLNEPYHSIEGVGVGTYGVFEFKKGWNIIEIDSYSNIDGTFILRVLEVLL